MLKKITVFQLRLGMHLHALEGAWLDHPFWKTKFVLSDPADLERLRTSGVGECWIDTAKGLDVGVAVDTTAPAAEPAAPATAPTQAPTLAPNVPRPEPHRSLQDELVQAAQVCQKARGAVLTMFNEARLGKALDAEHCMPLVDDIARSVYRNPGALVSLARLKTVDDYTYMHSVAVCALMVALGRQLGHDEAFCREAGLAGLLHDMGKAAMPLAILNKPGKLTDVEYAVMKTHPERGHEMLVEGRGAPPRTRRAGAGAARSAGVAARLAVCATPPAAGDARAARPCAFAQAAAVPGRPRVAPSLTLPL